MSTYKYIIFWDKEEFFAYCYIMHLWKGAKEYKPFIILNCKFLFYSDPMFSSINITLGKFRPVSSLFLPSEA